MSVAYIGPELWRVVREGAYWTRLEASKPGRVEAIARLRTEGEMDDAVEAYFGSAGADRGRQGLTGERPAHSSATRSVLRGVRSGP